MPYFEEVVEEGKEQEDVTVGKEGILPVEMDLGTWLLWSAWTSGCSGAGGSWRDR